MKSAMFFSLSSACHYHHYRRHHAFIQHCTNPTDPTYEIAQPLSAFFNLVTVKKRGLFFSQSSLSSTYEAMNTTVIGRSGVGRFLL